MARMSAERHCTMPPPLSKERRHVKKGILNHMLMGPFKVKVRVYPGGVHVENAVEEALETSSAEAAEGVWDGRTADEEAA